jgi:hypothetical protein
MIVRLLVDDVIDEFRVLIVTLSHFACWLHIESTSWMWAAREAADCR